MRKRATTDNERKLFQEAYKKAAPTVAASSVKKRGPAKTAKGQALAKLDLHGLTERNAHRILLTFLKSAAARGLPSALIVTGKGGWTDPHAPFSMDDGRRGVLRERVPHWLSEPDMKQLVSEVRPAPRNLGGDGALWVTIRKSARR